MMNKESFKQMGFVFCFALGLLIAHELGHIASTFVIPDCRFHEIIIFPFLSRNSDYLLFQCDYGFLATERNILIYHLAEFVFPFVFQSIYLLVFAKRLNTMELFLWFFISLLYLDGDFLSLYYYLESIL